MSIDFATLQGLTIPEGVVTQITDASGNILWSVGGKVVSLTNLLPALSSSSYTLSEGHGEFSTTHTKYASASAKLIGTADSYEVFLYSPAIPLDPTHIYYARAEVYMETVIQNFDFYWPIAEPKFYRSAPTTAGQWCTMSAVASRTEFTAGSYEMRFDFNNRNTAGTVWIDGLMIIDLTAAFGAGNEPTAKFCDAIPYFTGTYNYRYTNDVILEVEKITSNTYASETIYENESFILLDIYPKTNGAVSVTYGGLTKTISDTSGAEEPSAQKVFFGTFNGVSDSVTTPDSGTLTISGSYRAFAIGSYYTEKNSSDFCACVMAVTHFGSVTSIGNRTFSYCSGLTEIIIPNSVTSIGRFAFSSCTGLTEITIPDSVTSIGDAAFYNCSSLTEIIIPGNVTSISGSVFADCSSLTSVIIGDNVTSIEDYAFERCGSLTEVTIPNSVTTIEDGVFNGCSGLTEVTIPNSVTSIGSGAFYNCSSLTTVTFENKSGWYVTRTKGGDASTGTAIDVSDASNNVTLIKNTYCTYYWYRS